MKNRFCITIFLCAFLLTSTSPTNAALFGPKPGEACKVKLETKKINGKMYICDTNRIAKQAWILNSTPSNSEKATSLAFAGCVQGKLTDNSIYWYPRLYLGAILSYGYATDQIKYNAIWELDIWKSDYITSTFTAASTLDKNWAKLSSLWDTGLNNSLKKWKSGGLGGIEAINASQTFDVQIESICKVALSKIAVTAKKYGRSNPQFVLFSVGDMLPTPYGQ